MYLGLTLSPELPEIVVRVSLDEYLPVCVSFSRYGEAGFHLVQSSDYVLYPPLKYTCDWTSGLLPHQQRIGGSSRVASRQTARPLLPGCLSS